MKTRIIVECECGKKWEDSEDPEAAANWWEVLSITHPKLVAYVEQQHSEKTTELALRLIWAKHQAYHQEKGDKRSHEATVTQHITIESPEEVKHAKD